MKALFLIALSLSLFGAGCTSTSIDIPVIDTQSLPTPTPLVPSADDRIPDDDWERGEKEVMKEINRMTAQINEQPLRKAALKPNDIEVRLWVGFSIFNNRGHILKRRDDKWSGVSVVENGFNKHDQFNYRSVPMTPPLNGWDEFWQALLDHRLLTLPDARSIKCNDIEPDGTTYVIETRKGADYRAISYSSPDSGQCAEASDVIAIEKLFDQTYPHEP